MASPKRPAAPNGAATAQLEFQSVILHRVHDAVIAIDNAGIVTYLNPSAARQYGVDTDAAVGRPLSEIYSYRWINEGDDERAAAALADTGVWVGENDHLLCDGRVLHVESSVSVLHDADGHRSGLLAVIRDITEAKRIENRLRESDERQRMALDAADLGTWTHDIASGKVDLDERARNHYGIPHTPVAIDEVVARIHPDDRRRLQESIAAALDPAQKAPMRAEYRVRLPGGGIRWLSINGHVRFEMMDDRERAAIGVGTTRDITEQKRAEEILQDADRRKDEFLAILAHELRNPLAPIRTAVGILRSTGIPDALSRHSRDVIERQVAHMTRLIDDLLDVSRLSRGKMTLERGPLLLDDALDAAIETARPLIEEYGHHLAERRAPSAVCVDGDLARLSQVFANLLNNAAKYTPRGGTIALAAAVHGPMVEVTVSDTGQGIAAERLDHIFDLFSQGADPSPTAAGGLGIGLALVRRLVELHGGTVRAASDGPGHGATFTVTLPTIPDGHCEIVAEVHEPLKNLRRRVLVVDDSVDAADTTATLLEAAGCTVKTVYSGESTVPEITAFRPEIVLLDIGMPGVNGLDACRRIRAVDGGAAIFIVAVTGWGQEDDRRRTRDAGFDAHLVKPVAPDTLLDIVKRAPHAGAPRSAS